MYSVEILHEEMADVPSSMKQGIVRYSPADHNRLLFLKTYKLFTCGIFPPQCFQITWLQEEAMGSEAAEIK